MNFDKQIKRNYKYKTQICSSEKFSPTKFPKSSTKFKKYPSLDFRKVLGRREIDEDIRMSTPKYSPNYEKFMMPNLDKVGITFSKMINRPKLYITQKDPINYRNSYNHDKLLSNVPRIQTPNISKQTILYKKGQLLPSFMTSINSRLSLQTLSHEMIKANNFLLGKNYEVKEPKVIKRSPEIPKMNLIINDILNSDFNFKKKSFSKFLQTPKIVQRVDPNILIKFV